MAEWEVVDNDNDAMLLRGNNAAAGTFELTMTSQLSCHVIPRLMRSCFTVYFQLRSTEQIPGLRLGMC
jgi:hypothetical protein